MNHNEWTGYFTVPFLIMKSWPKIINVKVFSNCSHLQEAGNLNYSHPMADLVVSVKFWSSLTTGRLIISDPVHGKMLQHAGCS